MEKTDRLSMPLIVPGQAQKEAFHNEALQIVDILLAGAVEEGPRNDPPAAPAAGDCYIVGTAPNGVWGQYANHVAGYTTAGWRFIAPRAGMVLGDKSGGPDIAYGAGGWVTGIVRASAITIGGEQVLGAQATPIADPAGGTTVDPEARGAIAAMLAMLRQHGLIAE